MTAEIAILNAEAVALAADSAVAASAGSNQKIFSSQNKLFALSNVAPVGILIYGNATFMSIPWETLIKEYRRTRKGKTFAHLNEYLEDFCDFLDREVGSHLTEDHQTEYAKYLVTTIYREIAQIIQWKVTERLGDIFAAGVLSGKTRVKQVTDLVETLTDLVETLTEETIREYHSRARKALPVASAPNDFLDNIRGTLRASLKKIRHEVFGQTFKSSDARRLNEIAVRSVGAMFDDVALHPSGLSTGIAVAGFGDQELFPSLSEVHIEGFVVDVLKKRTGRDTVLGPDSRAWIVSFAQDDMIYQFMQGMAPDYVDVYLHESIISHLDDYTAKILENLSRYSDSEREALRERLKNVHPEIADSFVNWVQEVGKRYFALPIVDVVAMLPKDQLAEMAEALVSLTSLKRKVSLQEETVGGPTDVALITKGDGLIWVKRKHYFAAELNPGYFSRTYEGGKRYATNNA